MTSNAMSADAITSPPRLEKSGNGVTVIDPVNQFTAMAVRGTIIGTGLLGLTFYVKNSRLFAKYRHVKSIPKQYYQNEMLLKGVVREVTPTGIFKIEHQPIVSIAKLFGRKPKTMSLLNLRLAGIQILPEGLAHLTNDLRLTNRAVTFGVLKSTNGNIDAADSVINVKNRLFIQTNLNIDLVRKGMARVLGPDDAAHIEALRSCPAYARLVTSLLTSERVADRRGVGAWQRDTWIESLRSLPASFVQIIRVSAVTKLLILIYDILRDMTLVTLAILRHVYQTGVTLLGYSADAYRGFASGVDRASNFYLRLKNGRASQKSAVTNSSVKK